MLSIFADTCVVLPSAAPRRVTSVAVQSVASIQHTITPSHHHNTLRHDLKPAQPCDPLIQSCDGEI